MSQKEAPVPATSVDWVFLDNSDQDVLNKEGDSVDMPEIAAIQESLNSPTLSLHNSFDLLYEESELPSGETQLVNKDPNQISNVTLVDSAEIVDKVSEEIVSLSQTAHFKDSNNLQNVSDESVSLTPNNTKLVTDDGLPNPAPILRGCYSLALTLCLLTWLWILL